MLLEGLKRFGRRWAPKEVGFVPTDRKGASALLQGPCLRMGREGLPRLQAVVRQLQEPDLAQKRAKIVFENKFRPSSGLLAGRYLTEAEAGERQGTPYHLNPAVISPPRQVYAVGIPRFFLI